MLGAIHRTPDESAPVRDKGFHAALRRPHPFTVARPDETAGQAARKCRCVPAPPAGTRSPRSMRSPNSAAPLRADGAAVVIATARTSLTKWRVILFCACGTAAMQRAADSVPALIILRAVAPPFRVSNGKNCRGSHFTGRLNHLLLLLVDGVSLEHNIMAAAALDDPGCGILT